MSEERSTVCPSCHGRVRIPSRSRTFTLEQIIDNHSVSCPSRGVIKKGSHEESTST